MAARNHPKNSEDRAHRHAHGADSSAGPSRAVRQEEHAVHDKHAGHSVEMFRQKFLGTLLLTIPTVIWAPMIQEWFGYEAPGGPEASRWISALFGTRSEEHTSELQSRDKLVCRHLIEKKNINLASS